MGVGEWSRKWDSGKRGLGIMQRLTGKIGGKKGYFLRGVKETERG